MAFKAGSIYGEARLDTKKWNKGLKSLSKTAKIALAAVAAAVIVYMTKAVKAANEFQKAMSNVATLLDTTVVSTQKLTKQILLLDPALGKITDLTNGLYQAFSAGAETAKEAMQITVDSAKFARAGLTGMNEAVDVLTTAVNAYGRETMDTTKASDIFFTTIKEGKITGEELATSIGQVIPVYAATGIKLEELSAGLAAMTKQGINAHIATTQLRAIVSAFLKPSVDMTEALKDIGYESGSAFLEAEGLAGALKLVEDAAGGDAAVMAKLLPNIRALSGVMALTGVGGEEFNEILNEMETSAGATAVAFEKQEKVFDTLVAAQDKTMIVLGNIGKFFVDKVAAGAITAANSTLQFIMSNEGMELVAKIASYVASGFTLIKEAALLLWEIVKKSVIPVWEDIFEIFGDVTGETNAGAGAMKIFSIAINLAASAITVAGKVMQGLVRLIGDLVIAIGKSAEVVGEFFSFKFFKKEGREALKIKAQEAGEAFKTLGKNFVTSIGEIYETVRNEVKEFSGETEELTAHLTSEVTTTFENTTAYIELNWGEMLTGQAETTKLGVDDLRGIIGDGGKDIGGDLGSLGGDLKATWEDYFSAISDGFSQFYNGIAIAQRENFTVMRNDLKIEQQNELAAYQTLYQDELSILEERFEQGLISEEKYNAGKETLDKERTEFENTQRANLNTLEEKIFDADKKNKIGNIWIDAASAIMGWWATAPQLGAIFGPIFATTMTGLTGATAIKQITAINKQKFVPAMAGGGMVRVNEQGGEIITLPDKSQVIPNDISRQIARNINGTGTVIHVSFAGANIANDMDLDRITNKVIRKLGKEMRLAI